VLVDQELIHPEEHLQHLQSHQEILEALVAVPVVWVQEHNLEEQEIHLP
tara:strand:- start:194 stop:340 length:147 start_codon:yes stop_codon:yes gene_type:complete